MSAPSAHPRRCADDVPAGADGSSVTHTHMSPCRVCEHVALSTTQLVDCRYRHDAANKPRDPPALARRRQGSPTSPRSFNGRRYHVSGCFEYGWSAPWVAKQVRTHVASPFHRSCASHSWHPHNHRVLESGCRVWVTHVRSIKRGSPVLLRLVCSKRRCFEVVKQVINHRE